MDKAKLDLKNLTDQEVLDLTALIAGQMGGNANFPTPDPALTALTGQAATMSGALAARAKLLSDAQEQTLQIRAARDLLEGQLTEEAAYVDGIAKGDAAIIKSAGMDVSSGSTGRVGALPKVEGVFATQGDDAGEIDLQWNPVKRGLKSYTIEQTEDPAGQSGWSIAKVETRSKTSVTGLTSGKRYYFRISAVGAAGAGSPSDAVTKVAP